MGIARTVWYGGVWGRTSTEKRTHYHLPLPEKKVIQKPGGLGGSTLGELFEFFHFRSAFS